MLGGIVGAAAAAVVLLAGGSDGTDTVSGGWSYWHPTRDGQAAFQQIADHVGADYRLQNGKQLVAVTGGPLELANLPVTVAVKPTTSGGNISLLEGNGVLYTLCGLGKKCAISSGKPTQVRHLLLRRESLELALYTFRYVRDVDLVVVFLPPPPGKDASQAMLYRAKDVKGELNRPLVATLPGPAPRPNSFPAGQAAVRQRAHRAAPVQVHARAGPERERVPRPGPAPEVSRRAGGAQAAALERAKARLDSARRSTRRRSTSAACASSPRRGCFALPWFRRFHGYTMWNLILLRMPLAEAHDDLVCHELCHVWQMQHHPVAMPLSYLVEGYANNRHEIEARRAVELTR